MAMEHFVVLFWVVNGREKQYNSEKSSQKIGIYWGWKGKGFVWNTRYGKVKN